MQVQTKELVQKVEPKFLEVIKATGSELEWVKESGFAIQSLEANDLLKACTPASIMTAIYNVALTGLTLNPKLAYCYLVPRGGKAVLDISYQGLNFMMTNQLDVKSIHSEVVYKNDEFDYYTNQKGVNIHHRPDKFGERGEAVGVYALAYLRTGECVATVLNNSEIQAIKNTSKSAGSPYSPWSNFEDEMKKKTAIRRLWKIVPKTARVNEAIETINIDDQNYEPKWEKPKKVNDYKNMFKDDEIIPAEILEEPKNELPKVETLDEEVENTIKEQGETLKKARPKKEENKLKL